MVDKWFSNSNLLPKFKEERTEVISRFLFTFVAYKLAKHLNFSNTFSYLFHNYDVTSLENIIQSHFESMQSIVLLKACKHLTLLSSFYKAFIKLS